MREKNRLGLIIICLGLLVIIAFGLKLLFPKETVVNETTVEAYDTSKDKTDKNIDSEKLTDEMEFLKKEQKLRRDAEKEKETLLEKKLDITGYEYLDENNISCSAEQMNLIKEYIEDEFGHDIGLRVEFLDGEMTVNELNENSGVFRFKITSEKNETYVFGLLIDGDNHAVVYESN